MLRSSTKPYFHTWELSVDYDSLRCSDKTREMKKNMVINKTHDFHDFDQFKSKRDVNGR